MTSPTLGLVRRRLVGMSGTDVIEVVDAITAAGSKCVLAGGWGVDALSGRRTRRHADLDLAVDDGSELPAAAAGAALVALGFGFVRSDRVDDAFFGHRELYEDRRGRLVDLHAAHIGPDTDRADPSGVRVLGAASVSTGTIDGRTVACLSVSAQLASHAGYDQRRVDRRDRRLLERLRHRDDGAPAPGAARSGTVSSQGEGRGDAPPSVSVV